MKIAYTIGFVRVPPTYFAVQHPDSLRDVQAKLFGFVAECADPTVKTPMFSATPRWASRLSFKNKAAVSLLYGGRLTNEILRFEPDIIHQHFATWALPGIKASKRLDIPLVVTLHGYDVFNQFNVKKNFLQKWHSKNFTEVAKEADICLPVSKYLARQAVKAGIPQEKVKVHYQGVDTDFFTPDDSVYREDVPTILHVGRLSKMKGVEDLLKTSFKLFRKYPHRVNFVGDGPLRDVVASAASQYDHISYLGSKNRLGVRDAMRQADLFVLATKKDGYREEAAGLVTLEAQACGTPVVVNASGGTTEMIREGVTGFSAERDNVESLKTQIERFLSLSAGDRTQMGYEAREFVVAHRSLKSSCKALKNIYQNLL